MSELERVGLHLDDSNRIRVLDPESSRLTNELLAQSEQFVESSANFQRIVDDFVGIVDGLAKEVDQAKITALGTRNMIKSIENERLAERQQLEALICEKRLELERLKTQLQSLARIESDQRDFMEQLNNSKD